MSARIDYVRLRLQGDKFTRKADTTEWNERAEVIIERHQLKGKPFDEFLVYDHILKGWTTFWNIWGFAAEVFYNELELVHFAKVVRLDYRVPLDNKELDIEAVALFAIANAKNKGINYDFHGGRVKTKRNGRDTGGPSLSVGSKDSARRIALYKRGHEFPGVEAQIAQNLLKSYITSAYDSSVIASSSFHEELKDLLEKETDKLCRERLLYPLEAFTGDEPIYMQSSMSAVPDKVYEQVNLLWGLLDLDQRSQMMNGMLEAYGTDLPVQPIEYADESGDEYEDRYGDDYERSETQDRRSDDYDHDTQGDW